MLGLIGFYSFLWFIIFYARINQTNKRRGMRIDLQGFTPRQYAMLIMKDELKHSYERAGRKLGISRYAAASMYKRAKLKIKQEEE